MCLHPLMNKRQLTSFRSLKIHHVLAFWPFLPQYQLWSPVCLSADAYKTNKEWGSPMPISACTKERVEERHLSFHYSAYYYTLLWPERRASFPHNPENGWGCPISLSQSFIECTGVACSDSVSHNRVQVLSIPVLLLACSQDWTCNLQMIVS